MLTLEGLKALGVNTEEGLTRCMNNESFYLRLCGRGIEDANFERLETSRKAGSIRESFEAAHALKGVLGNLAITPVLKPVTELTEKLRNADAMPEYEACLREINEQRAKIVALAKEG